ncbi:MAG: hypothetical protein U0736_08970 [Gemmataceae bacterium]
MQNSKCPACGQDVAPGAACPGCGHAISNGTAPPCRVKPPPPPELASRTFTPTPAAVLERMRRTFDEEEYRAAVRELERTGGHRLEDFIEEIERIAHGRE